MDRIYLAVPDFDGYDQPATLMKIVETTRANPEMNNNSVIQKCSKTRIPKIPVFVWCQNCDINFPTKFEFQRHHCKFIATQVKPKENGSVDLQNDGKRRYICATCGMQFLRKFNLQRHLPRHQATLKDKQAPKSKPKVSGRPRKLVTQDKVRQKNCKPKHICKYCSKSFSYRCHLITHINQHEGNKPFACTHDGCTARFALKSILKDHCRKMHTRERPFKCEVCKQSFMTGSVYYQHCLIHKIDRRYDCEICGKKFFRSHALTKHGRIHSGEKPYSCEVCSKTFRQKCDLNRHLKTQHYTSI